MKDRLRALWCDHLSILRGKYLPNHKIEDGSTRFCRSTFGVHYDKDLLDAPGAMMKEGLPDMELRWREADIRDSWESSTQIVIGDLYDQDGVPLELSPLMIKMLSDGQRRYGVNAQSDRMIERLEEATGLSITAAGFPTELTDDEPEARGYEVPLRQ